MPSKQTSIYSNSTLDATVTAYQRSRGLKSFSAAATELLIKGIEYWITSGEDDQKPHWGESAQDEETLVQEWRDWQKSIYAERDWDEYADLTDEQSKDLTFERYLLLKITPKHGGKRDGAGHKKEAVE